MTTTHSPFNMIVLVAALGYFVDIYDLVLFSIVRRESLLSLGLAESELLTAGVRLLNWQMGGMLLGGILWGVLGDKKGRISVLFGSIFLYSAANIANGFVQSVDMYAFLRFVAGVGLAGELGVGITLVSETMTKENRGYGTMIVATVGICGAIVAALVGDSFDWRIAYYVGGGMGLLLLLLRIGVYESGMFRNIEQHVKRGNLGSLFRSRKKVIKYLSVILIGVPIWYVVAILITFSPEMGKAMGMEQLPSAGKAVMYCYIGLALGDFASGFLSQIMKTRKKVVFGFLGITVLGIVSYFMWGAGSLTQFYIISLLLGFGTGYWAVFVTMASELFGTNIRATVTTTAPNFVRGSVVPITLAFGALKGTMGILASAAIVGALTIVIAVVSLYMLEETFGKDLDYIESES